MNLFNTVVNYSLASLAHGVLAAYLMNKKRSCRRETAPSFLSLNISLSQSRSFKIIGC